MPISPVAFRLALRFADRFAGIFPIVISALGQRRRRPIRSCDNTCSPATTRVVAGSPRGCRRSLDPETHAAFVGKRRLRNQRECGGQGAGRDTSCEVRAARSSCGLRCGPRCRAFHVSPPAFWLALATGQRRCRTSGRQQNEKMYFPLRRAHARGCDTPTSTCGACMTRMFFVSAAGVKLDACGLQVTVLCRIQAANVQYCNERHARMHCSRRLKERANRLNAQSAATPADVGVSEVS